MEKFLFVEIVLNEDFFVGDFVGGGCTKWRYFCWRLYKK